MSGGDALHALVNNAGCMVHERTVTPEGVEANFATNTLGTWALTEGLMPALRRAGGDARVVTVSSAGMLTEKLELDDLEMARGRFDGTRQYAKNKRHQVALTQRWARVHGGGAHDPAKQGEAAAAGGGGGAAGAGEAKEDGVGFYAMHPGWSDTDAVKTALPGFYSSLKKRLRTPWQGADTAAWLCVAPASALRNGSFYLDRAPVPVHLYTGPLTGTEYSDEEVERLARKLEERFREATG